MDSLEPFTSVEASLAASQPRSLHIAARSLLESQALPGSVASVIAEGALHHHYAGLFQYATIRCGLAEAGPALARLEALSATWQADEAQPELHGGRLYRALSEILPEHPGKALSPEAGEWWVPEDERLRGEVVRLRRTLTSRHQQLLELRYTRGLDLAEVALAVGQSVEATQEALAQALEVVDHLLGSARELDTSREDVLLQAFALDPRRARGPARPSRKPVLAVGTVIGGRYEVEEPLGAGAFSDVYRARDREVTDHVVALKILRRASADEHATRTALRELQLIASVFHPSVVQLKDHGWHQGHLWFVMPFYRGETLAQRLRRAPLDRREARKTFEALAEALATMHRLGVRHQDIKPENVFLANIDPEGGSDSLRVLPVLLDLGVAAKDAELVLAGTPAYLAPEVAARFAGVPDPPPVGPKADVFSLALTLREALEPTPTHILAVGAVDAFVALRGRRAPAPPRSREFADLKPLFARWLNVAPDARPSADEFRHELAALTRPAERRAKRVELLRWALPMAVAVLALFGAVVYVLSREASLRRLEAVEERLRADQARDRAATIHASLEEEEARRRSLEADIARLDAQYQSSRMTREQLATRLAAAEGELALVTERQTAQLTKMRHLGEDLRLAREQQASLSEDLLASRSRVEDLSQELDRSRANLDGERSRRAELESHVETLTTRLKATDLVVDEARARVAELEQQLAAALQNPKPAPQPRTPAQGQAAF